MTNRRLTLLAILLLAGATGLPAGDFQLREADEVARVKARWRDIQLRNLGLKRIYADLAPRAAEAERLEARLQQLTIEWAALTNMAHVLKHRMVRDWTSRSGAKVVGVLDRDEGNALRLRTLDRKDVRVSFDALDDPSRVFLEQARQLRASGSAGGDYQPSLLNTP